MSTELPVENHEEQTPAAVTPEEKPPRRKKRVYFYSFDALRVICITMLTFSSFGLPMPILEFIRPYLNSATGILFTLYGFLVLRDGADLKKNIKHSVKVFAILFAVYGLMTAGYLWLIYGKPFMYITKRGIFNFVVLNYWGDAFCSTIWYVQSTVYALIICWIFKGLKKYDWIICILLFALAAMIGELAGVINFSFLGNEYIPGNFLTRTIPYMLLGRIINRSYRKLKKGGSTLGKWLVIGGLIISVGEHFLLTMYDMLGYSNHLIGFILISAGACLLAVRHPKGVKKRKLAKYAKRMYKGMYYVFNPLGYIFLLAATLLCRTQEQFFYCRVYAGLAVAVINFAVFYRYSKAVHRMHVKKAIALRRQKRLEKELGEEGLNEEELIEEELIEEELNEEELSEEEGADKNEA